MRWVWHLARRPLFWALVVGGMAFALYAPTLGFDYAALDDDVFVVQNALVPDGFTRASVKAAWTTAPEANWVPLLWMSYMLDVDLYGMEPWGFHLTNVLLFSLNVGLLFGLARRWTGRTGVGLAVALLWMLHPTRVESVAWITERKDVLSGLFFLMGTGAYVEGKRGNWKHGVQLAWLCMLLGGLSKQILIVMPVALMLLDVWPLKRTDWDRIWRDGWRLAAEKWAFWMLAVLLASAPLWAHHRQGALIEMSWGYRLQMIPIHYLFYLGKLLWPTELMPLQDEIAFHWGLLAAGLGMLGGITWALWRCRTGHPLALMGWLWFVALLFPLTGVVWGGAERMATRFMYLPQIGLIVALVVEADDFLKRRGLSRGWGLAACLLLMAAYAGQTRQLLPHWRNKDSFAQAVWRYNSGHESACLLGGDSFLTRGEWGKAEEAYTKGSLLHNKKCFGRVSLIWIWRGQAEGADRLWQAFESASGTRLLDFRPAEVPEERGVLWNVHGAILRAQGDYAGAIAALKNAVELEPDPAAFVVAEFLRTCHEAGRPEAGAEAAARLKAAKGLEIRDWRDLLPRYLQFWQEGGRGLAFGYFTEYARRHPDDGMALNNMAWLVATAEPDGLDHARQEEWPTTAVAWAEAAIELGGEEFAGAWDTLAAARANAGDFEGAVAAAERAMDLAKRSGEWALADKVQGRLDGYRSGRPWREEDERVQKSKGR